MSAGIAAAADRLRLAGSSGQPCAPVRTLFDAARLVAEAGETLSPGDIVLAGAAMSAEALRPGVHVRLEVQNLGAVEFSVSGS